MAELDTITRKDDANSTIRSVDLFLLFFLLGFMMDKVVAKPVMIVVALLWMGRHIDWKALFKSPWFYLVLPAMELVRFFVFQKDFSSGHIVSFIIGESYWIMALMAFLIVKTIVSANSRRVTETTLLAWFLINAFVSIFQLLAAMYHSGSINPYGLSDPAYGSSTGDYIQGVMLAPCHINMLANALFAIYFLYRKHYGLYFFATVIAILTSTNFGNIVFVAVIISLFFYIKSRMSRQVIALQFVAYFIFYVFVSQSNLQYLLSSILEQYRRPEMDKMKAMNGKALSLGQTYDYVTGSPAHFAFGAGMGNFSSLLALRMSKLKGQEHSRFFELMPDYVAEDYRQNHYQIFKNIFDLPPAYHSAKNFPHSFVNQIFGEYGVVGFIIFMVGYAWYFLKWRKQLSYYMPMCVMIAGFLFFDYLFEYLSIMVLFELFFFLDIKRNESVHA